MLHLPGPIGILALQGAVEPHRHKFSALSEIEAKTVSVRTAQKLITCAGLVIPGGESTTLLKLIGYYDLAEPLRSFAQYRPVWGVCAGTILMAEQVENPTQDSLGLVPFTVRRNAYGRQNESFIAKVQIKLPDATSETLEGVFIRAPKILPPDSNILPSDGDEQGPQQAGMPAAETQILASHDGFPVAIQFKHHLLTTFHPELSHSDALHQHFISLCHIAAERAIS